MDLTLLMKLVADLKAGSYVVALADALQLSAMVINFLFAAPVPASTHVTFAAAPSHTLPEMIAALEAHAALGAIDWKSLLPMLAQLITLLLPLVTVKA